LVRSLAASLHFMASWHIRNRLDLARMQGIRIEPSRRHIRNFMGTKRAQHGDAMMTPKEMIDAHRSRHNVMAGHYWMELASQMADEIKRLTMANRKWSQIADERSKENCALRARERKIIDETWGEALEDGSMPSTKLQDKIIAAIDAAQGIDQCGKS